MLRVSLVLTVKNEAPNIPRLFDSLAQQTRLPDQIVCVDGGSGDNTLATLQKYATTLPLKIISQPGANISKGRNTAIRCADADIIAATDAGVRLDSHWLEEIVRPFESDEAPDVVSGWFVPDPQTVFELALAATTLPAREDIRADKFLPSSRSMAFKKRVWEQTAQYPEWLDYGEDLVFDLDLRAAGCRFSFAPNAWVYFRPRASLGAFFKQYYLYARGDGKAKLWSGRHLIRYLTYLVALPSTLAIIARESAALGLAIVAVGALGMFFTPYKRLTRMAHSKSPADILRAGLWIPLIRVTGDVAKMLGYPIGVLWRIQNNSARRHGEKNATASTP